jgi:hypothetical protein
VPSESKTWLWVSFRLADLSGVSRQLRKFNAGDMAIFQAVNPLMYSYFSLFAEMVLAKRLNKAKSVAGFDPPAQEA